MTNSNTAITNAPVEIPDTWDIVMPDEVYADLVECKRNAGFTQWLVTTTGIHTKTITAYIKNKSGKKGRIDKLREACREYKILIGKENAA